MAKLPRASSLVATLAFFIGLTAFVSSFCVTAMLAGSTPAGLALVLYFACLSITVLALGIHFG